MTISCQQSKVLGSEGFGGQHQEAGIAIMHPHNGSTA
jgi:hypothetical protein